MRHLLLVFSFVALVHAFTIHLTQSTSQYRSPTVTIPAPTTPPQLPTHLRRENGFPREWCGFLGGNFSDVVACPTSSYCVTNVDLDRVGCCAQGVTYDCTFYTGCVDYSSFQRFSSPDPSILSCEYTSTCEFYTYPGDKNQYACRTGTGTNYVAVTWSTMLPIDVPLQETDLNDIQISAAMASMNASQVSIQAVTTSQPSTLLPATPSPTINDTPSSTASTSLQTSTSAAADTSSHISTGIIVGVAVGAFLVISVAIALIIRLIVRKRVAAKTNPSSPRVDSVDPPAFPDDADIWDKTYAPQVRVISGTPGPFTNPYRPSSIQQPVEIEDTSPTLTSTPTFPTMARMATSGFAFAANSPGMIELDGMETEVGQSALVRASGWSSFTRVSRPVSVGGRMHSVAEQEGRMSCRAVGPVSEQLGGVGFGEGLGIRHSATASSFGKESIV